MAVSTDRMAVALSWEASHEVLEALSSIQFDVPPLTCPPDCNLPPHPPNNVAAPVHIPPHSPSPPPSFVYVGPHAPTLEAAQGAPMLVPPRPAFIIIVTLVVAVMSRRLAAAAEAASCVSVQLAEVVQVSSTCCE